MEEERSTWCAGLDLTDEKSKRLSLQLIVKRHLPPEAVSWDYDAIITALNKISHVRLDRENLREIDNFELLGPSVTNVYLQRNCIEKIENLSCLTNLVFLMLASNKISKVENLNCLCKLAFLDVSDNCIETYDVDEFPQSLVILNLNGNPCTALPDHRGSIIQELPYLRQLNGEDITNEERLEAGYSVSSDEDEDEKVDRDAKPPKSLGAATVSHGTAQPAGNDSLKILANDMLERSQMRLEESFNLHKQHSEDLLNMRTKYRLLPRSAGIEGQAAGDHG